MASDLKTNVLYYGDNLEILRKYIPANSVDLIYLDPPFNSKKDYNILFREKGGLESEAQIHAFSDTWHWTRAAEDAYQEIVLNSSLKVGKLIESLRGAIGSNDVMAYLVMMTIRLLEMHRVLKSTGSLYLHCDPTASHYLKIILDQIFGPTNFRNEIVWRRSQTRSSISRIFKRAHDTILVYAKSSDYKFDIQYKGLSNASLALYSKKDEKGLYRLVPLVVSGKRQGETGKIWKGIDPNLRGKAGSHWVTTPSKLDEYEKQGLVVWPVKEGGLPQLKYYLEGNRGVPVTDFWDDIDLIPSSSGESLGYETQKPLGLLERIISASSNKGDVVLDPFCGCGTAVVAAQKLNRKWIGIDITHLAINLMRNRLKDSFPRIKFEVIGEPKDLSGAKALANQDRYQFQWWALGLIGARPVGDKKKGADKGVDGIIPFIDNPGGKTSRVVVQVKSGHVGVNVLRELRTVAEEEAIGVLITLEPPTTPMLTEAVSAGYYHSPLYDKDYPKIQILTIEELFQEKTVEMPSQTQTSIAFTKAPKIKKDESPQGNMIYMPPGRNGKASTIRDGGGEQLPFYRTE